MRAAQAIERAVIELGAAREVRHVDTLEYTTKVFRNLYSRAYIDMVNKAPDVLGWLYDQMDKPWKNERRRLAFDKLNTRPFVRFLKDYRPDITICTHFLPAEIISWLKAKRRLDTRQAIVVTDFDVHAMWLVHHFERYFVALEETRAHLQKLGIPSAKITASGIPIDPVFASPKDKFEMRRKHGLLHDVPAILISAGGLASGALLRSSIRCLKSSIPPRSSPSADATPISSKISRNRQPGFQQPGMSASRLSGLQQKSTSTWRHPIFSWENLAGSPALRLWLEAWPLS